MKIGVCTSPDKLPLLTELGYDYFEACFSWLADLDEESFRAQTALVEKFPARALISTAPAQALYTRWIWRRRILHHLWN